MEITKLMQIIDGDYETFIIKNNETKKFECHLKDFTGFSTPIDGDYEFNTMAEAVVCLIENLKDDIENGRYDQSYEN